MIQTSPKKRCHASYFREEYMAWLQGADLDELAQGFCNPDTFKKAIYRHHETKLGKIAQRSVKLRQHLLANDAQVLNHIVANFITYDLASMQDEFGVAAQNINKMIRELWHEDLTELQKARAKYRNNVTTKRAK